MREWSTLGFISRSSWTIFQMKELDVRREKTLSVSFEQIWEWEDWHKAIVNIIPIEKWGKSIFWEPDAKQDKVLHHNLNTVTKHMASTRLEKNHMSFTSLKFITM